MESYQCSSCGSVFSQRSQLVRHMRTHTAEKPYQCIHCDKSFLYDYHLKRHLRSHNGEKTYQCSHCEKVLLRMCDFVKHLKTHTGEKTYQCIHCEKAYFYHFQLKRHLKSHTGEKPYQCNHCQRSFSQNCNLIKHLSIHSADKPYQCSHCDKTFSQNSHLISHLKFALRCSILEKDFTQKTNILCHKRTHTGEKNFQCTHCKKIFSNDYHLKSHVRTHTGEKPYQCSHCLKAYSHNYQLIRHMVSHTNEKMYQCRHCDKAFSYNCHLLSHIKLSLRCSILDKDFTQKTSILYQTRAPANEKPSQSSDSENVISNNNLIWHSRAENGEKNQSSQIDKAFSQNINFMDHNIFTSTFKQTKSVQAQTQMSNIISNNQTQQQYLYQNFNIPSLVPFPNPTFISRMATNPNDNQNKINAKGLQFSSGSKHLYQVYSIPTNFKPLLESETYCKIGHADFPRTNHADVPIDLVLNPNMKYIKNNTDNKQTHILPYRPWEQTSTHTYQNKSGCNSHPQNHYQNKLN